MALLPVDQATQRILKGVRRLSSEYCSIEHALGRVTAAALVGRRDQPPFDASAMDGYAVRYEDVQSVPTELNVIGTSSAGKSYRGSLKPKAAVRIFTGAPIPKGADAVVIQENTERNGDVLIVKSPSKAGQNIRLRGLDFRLGDKLIPTAATLTPRDIALAAAMNCATLSVVRKPRIAVLATGDELVPPGTKPRADQIVSSNSNALVATAIAMGGEAINGGIVRDNLKATVRAINRLSDADILITTGGASVGDHDYVQEALKLAGVKIDFWKIAMRPGKPFMYGRKGKLHVLGLPGNPVSALVCAELFLRPLVRAMLGLEPSPPLRSMPLGGDLPANDERQDHIRARFGRSSTGELTAVPFAKQDSSMMRTYREADCLIVRPAHAPAVAIGTKVPVILL